MPTSRKTQNIAFATTLDWHPNLPITQPIPQESEVARAAQNLKETSQGDVAEARQIEHSQAS